MYKKAKICSLVLVSSLFWAGTVAADQRPPAPSPPPSLDVFDCRESAACRIDVELPAETSKPPQVPHETLVVRAGQTVTWTTKEPVMVAFYPDTPFASGGRPLHHFTVGPEGRTLTVRSDRNKCQGESCKYSVIDVGNDERAVLDPYIIIQP